MNPSRFTLWHEKFLNVVQEPVSSAPLKAASVAEDLKTWTACLTAAVVASCRQLDWPAAAKGHRLAELPQAGQEYLGIDVMAFPDATDAGRWRLPLAAFELENHPTDDRVAYSLWKVLCIRAPLRVVFAFRRDWEARCRRKFVAGRACRHHGRDGACHRQPRRRGDLSVGILQVLAA
jgi:hypothetical protein